MIYRHVLITFVTLRDACSGRLIVECMRGIGVLSTWIAILLC